MATFERNGVRLHYTESGAGPPVLWHTGGGGDGRMWELAGYPDRLPGRRHLLLDHRGHGQSGTPTDPGAHALSEYVADALGVLDVAAVDRAVLVGYSAGARVCLRVAARHPDRVSALVAVGGVPIDFDVSELNRASAAEVRASGMRAAMEELSASEGEPAPAWLVDNLAETPAEMFALMLEAWAAEPGSWEDLPRVSAPTLLVCGELETTGRDARAAETRLPDGEVVRLAGFGHLQTFWHAELTGAAIAAFVDRRVPV